MRRSAIALFAAALVAPAVWTARAQEPVPAEAPVVLLLEVSINGAPTGLVARFESDRGRLSLAADQFAGLGLIVREAFVSQRRGERRIELAAVPGAAWRLDMPAQSIDLLLPADLIVPQRLSIVARPEPVQARSDWGALLTYSVFGEYALRDKDNQFRRAVSADLEARVFGSGFVASTTAYVPPNRPQDLVRLESYAQFAWPVSATTLTAGDSYTGGLAFDRPIRFGGVQLRRNFSLRPDILTQPALALSSGVTAPSALDLYVNGVKQYAGKAAPGAILLDDLPLGSGVNRVTMVLTDANGRQQRVSVPFYASSLLLAPGLTDYSLEAGAIREGFTVQSLSYGRPFASATVRRGVTPALTLEGHAEAASGFLQAAGGVRTALRNWLLVGANLGVSTGPRGTGTRFVGSLAHSEDRLGLALRVEASDDAFQDLADLDGQPLNRSSVTASAYWRLSPAQTLNLAYVLQRRRDGIRSEVATVSYTRDLFRNRVRLDANAFGDLVDRGWGASLSVSVIFGARGLATATATHRSGGDIYLLDASGGSADGDLNWRARVGAGETRAADASVSYRGRLADVSARLMQVQGATAAQLDLRQSLVLFGGQLYAAGPVNDAFTVVETPKAPGVPVFLENREVGKTDRRGRLLVDDLRGYEANRISIDPGALPLNAQVEEVEQQVAPRARGGVLTRFHVDQERAALVQISFAAGRSAPVGAEVLVEGVAKPSMLGFGGETYVRGFGPGRNRLRVVWAEGACSAEFVAPPDSATIPRVVAETCR